MRIIKCRKGDSFSSERTQPAPRRLTGRGRACSVSFALPLPSAALPTSLFCLPGPQTTPGVGIACRLLYHRSGSVTSVSGFLRDSGKQKRQKMIDTHTAKLYKETLVNQSTQELVELQAASAAAPCEVLRRGGEEAEVSVGGGQAPGAFPRL